jgi:phosphoribosylformimino-5-aminoimidazole carboxamide ribotide isomerase
MIIYPAIDIRDGRCVRLVEGDFSRETVYDDDPVDAARRWVASGAEWLHVVDLDGARSGSPANKEAIRRICREVDIPVQLGGGLRSADDVEAAFESGVHRAILGTVALQQPDLVEQLAAAFPDRIAVGLDARNNRLAVAGWIETSEATPEDTARYFAGREISTFIFTDIGRDGTLSGPNLDALHTMAAAVGDAELIASGGIGSQDDVTAVAATGVAGVIIGRALYDGRVDLARAIDAVRNEGRISQ